MPRAMLAALVSTQLAQTVVAGGWSPTVLAASAASLGVLVAVVQTPGLSQFFGRQRLAQVAESRETSRAKHGEHARGQSAGMQGAVA